METIGAEAAKLAGLQIDLLQKYRAGHITVEHLEWFLGLTKSARDARMADEQLRLEAVGYRAEPENLVVPVVEPIRRWREEDGVIYFTLPATDGTTGLEWIERLEGKRFRLGGYAKSVLRSPDFVPTSGVVNEIAVLKGELFSDDERITKKIRAEADRRKLGKPNAEVACLIRENFSDAELEAMGLWWIVVMHDPIRDSGGDPNLLGADRRGDGHWLRACLGSPEDRWYRGHGFAFAVPQV